MRQYLRPYVLFALLIPQLLFAQSPLIDSLKSNLKGPLNDSVRVTTLAALGWEVSYNDLEKGLSYCNQAKELAEKIGYKRGLGQALNNIGTIYNDLGEYPKAIEAHLKEIDIAKQLHSNSLLGTAYVNISRVYFSLKNEAKSEIYDRMALQTFMNSYNDIVLKNHEITEPVRKQLNYMKSKMALVYANISRSLELRNEVDSAINYLFKSMRINEELRDVSQLASNYQNIGALYERMHLFDKAELYLKRAKNCCQPSNSYQLAEVYFLLGEVRGHLKKSKEAIEDLNSAIECARKVGLKHLIMMAYFVLSETYEEDGRLKEALLYQKRYAEIKDTILKENQKVQVNLVQSKLENERKRTEIDLLEQKSKVNEAESSKQRTVIYSVIFLLLAASILAYVLYKRNKEKIKVNTVLAKQKSEIESQKQVVDLQNQEIKDSINYAQRIQQTILPDHQEINKYFNNWFVFFQPKDIVSGDFYWFAHKENKTYVAAVDCTGHGVPGAFMSMIGYTLLNEIINNSTFNSPADILSELRNGVIKSLKQKGVEGENKDGMDISLCLFYDNTVEFAGANNPLWLIRNNELFQYKADKQPIGVYGDKLNPFTNHTIDLKQGDAIYLFTDGYADQFGGPHGKKFKYAQLKEVLIQTSSNIAGQKQILQDRFTDWKGKLEQVDDVLLIGIQI